MILRDSPRFVLLVFVILYLFLSPDIQQSSPGQRKELKHLIQEERQAADILASSRYGDFDPSHGRWLNLTGLDERSGYVWDLLTKVKTVAHAHIQKELGDLGEKKLNGRARGLRNGTATAEEVVDIGDAVSELDIPVYQNVTGLVRGEWTRSPVALGRQAPMINLTDIAPDSFSTLDYNRNITGEEGRVQFKLDQKNKDALKDIDGSVREVRATMTIKDEASSGDGWEMTLHGVHFEHFGGIILSTTSEKFAGLFTIPHFTLSEHTFSLAQRLLNMSVSETITKQESAFETFPSYPWSSSPNSAADVLFPVPHCEYIVYLQQHSRQFVRHGSEALSSPESAQVLLAVEREIRFRDGAPVPAAPDMSMSMILFSPDCGFVLESKGPPRFSPDEALHLHGPKLETYMRLARNYSLAFALVCALQLTLLIRQMKEASTPSTVSRLSFYTIAVLAMGDGFACIGFMTLGILVESTFVAFASTAFLAFVGVTCFGMKFLMDIWTVQAPERREQRVLLAGDRASPAAGDAATTDISPESLPLPVTARQPGRSGSTPVILPPDQDSTAAENEGTQPRQPTAGDDVADARREVGALYSRFYFLLLAVIFLSLHATTWPTVLRSVYANVMSFLYLSFWLPQIYRNVMRNCRKALSWEFVLGQSILRLSPFVYFYTFPGNILFIEPNQGLVLALVGWIWLQICALASQDILGPRLFVPDGWAPPAYDYHPLLKEEDLEEGGLMVSDSSHTGDGEQVDDHGLDTTGSESKLKGRRIFGCAICMQDVEVPIVSTSATVGDSTTGGIFARRTYMITPCKHVFHSHCLENWMKYRLQCPIDRVRNVPHDDP